MKKELLYIILFLFSCILSAQGADNSLQGYYKAVNDQTLYGSFNFDGNGKVLISDMDYGDYFTRNDSLIIYPDKSIFIFKIKKGKLSGISDWVEKGVWNLKKDSSEINNRRNPVDAVKKAQLLAEYYDKTKSPSKSDLDFEALVSGKTSVINEELCNKGLAKACMNLFGLKMMEYTPGLFGDPAKIAAKKLKPHPELIALSKKIVDLGEPEGYTVLGSYYYTIGLKDKAFKTWDEGEKNGSLKSGTTKAMIEFQEELEKEETADKK
ncbi:hypothetical protein CEY12_04240 [Chryseobacterium sp. T16E-39]|uniref:hypothetical protein n=1 Tax=Chryseobacterium sp. T16E-39 TaxID=2015076 RepID=UPI000B5B12B7|nr:hypothetical protein [Chryseobacterium sp. T16E-39]ASK29354.1 hypothetical protein CEY12_04240 [Chryseobacterium sp. T16E-39]